MNRTGTAGAVLVAFFVVVAALAPLLANDRPVVASLEGEVVFPAFTTYVDAWVPYRSLRYRLRAWEPLPGRRPLSDHYTALDGGSWAEAGPDWAVWPPIPFHPDRFDGSSINRPPGGAHLLGTDDQGRDVLARIVHGAVVALLVGVMSQLIAGVVGALLGLLAGYRGGRTDLLLSRVVEVVMCFPTFFLVIAVIAFLEPSIANVVVVLGLVGWTRIFRLVRGETLQCRRLDYVVAAQALGIPAWQVMWRHVLPNVLSPVFVALTFGAAGAVLTEAGLSFLGLGDVSAPSLGEIVLEGRLYVGQGLWHLALYPGLALFALLLGFNLLGQGLRDALDVRLDA